MAWDGENPHPVGHDHVLALPEDAEASLLERANRVLVIDASNLGHVLRDFDFAYDGPFQQVFPGG